MAGISRVPFRSWLVVGALALGACGGGGDWRGTASSESQGGAVLPAPGPRNMLTAVAGGTIERAEDPSFILVRPGDGNTWLFYGPDLGSTSRVTGYVAASDASAASSNGVPYNASDSAQDFRTAVSLQIAVDPLVPTVVGSLRYGTETTEYKVTGGPIPGSNYRFNQPASIADVVGSWSLTDLQGNSVSLSIRPDGSISGTYQGCAVTGQFAPGTGNVNRMDLEADLAGCPASRPNALGPNNTGFGVAQYTGFGVAFPMTTGETQLLLFARAIDEATWNADSLLAIGRR